MLSENAVLKHSHPVRNNPQTGRYLFHDANTVHTSDPEAHALHNAFNPYAVTWSARGKPVFSDESRAQLIHRAQLQHIENVRRTYSRGTLQAEVRELPPPPPAEDETTQTSIGTAAPTPADDTGLGTVIAALAQLPDRVDELERTSRADDERIRLASKDAAAALRRVLDESRERSADISVINNKIDAAEAITERVQALESAARRNITIILRTPTETKTLNGVNHVAFPKLLALMSALDPEDRNVWIAGPAGSGKTTAARKLAEALSLPFYFNGAIDSEYKLSGFIDAQGRIISTAFRKAWELGGVYLFDECDASMPPALLAFNAALANGHAAFPDKVIQRHTNTYVGAAANTWGFGGDANYVGRMKLDAAFLDRFVTLAWDYDPYLERTMVGGSHTLTAAIIEEPPLYIERTTATAPPVDEWVDVVQTVRRAARAAEAQVVISPRASAKGVQLLCANIHPYHVVEAVFGRYKDGEGSSWPHYLHAAERFARTTRSAGGPVTVAPGVSSNGKLQANFTGVNVYGNRR